MYKVTLSMPIYNVAPYVERALLSALNQTFESIEFLLVDDRGIDNSMEIVRRIIKDHPRGKDVRIIEHPYNVGLGATRNTAIDNAQGEYLFFMDSDDEITPDCIQVLYDKMMEEKVDMVVGSSQSINMNGMVSEHLRLDNVNRRGVGILINYHYVENHIFPVYTWNKLYSLSFLKENCIRCIAGHNCEDLYFSFNVERCVQSFSYINNITYSYYIRSNSFMDRIQSHLSIREVGMLMDFLLYKKSYIREIKDITLQDILLHSIYRSVRVWGEYILSSDKMNMNEKYRGIVGFYSDMKFNKYTTNNRIEKISIGLYFIHRLSDVLLFTVLVMMVYIKKAIR